MAGKNTGDCEYGRVIYGGVYIGDMEYGSVPVIGEPVAAGAGALSVKAGGAWVQVIKAYQKIAGSWQPVTIRLKVAGAWIPVVT